MDKGKNRSDLLAAGRKKVVLLIFKSILCWIILSAHF